MNKKRCLIIFIIVLMFAIIMPLHAEDFTKIAQSGMTWLSIPIGARAQGMGAAYTAMANDVTSLFWNPAGLAYTERAHFFIARTNWIADINVNALAVSYNAKQYGVFALSFASADWGTIHGTQRANNNAGFIETGDFSPEHYGIGLGYGRRISDKLMLGLNLRYLHENLGSNMIGTIGGSSSEFTAETNLIAFDFGTIYNTGFKDLRFGMSFLNFSKEVRYREEYYSLPLTFKFGLAMEMLQLFSEPGNHGLTLAVDAIHPRDFSERVNFGLEYGFRQLVFFRGGYKYNYDEENFTVGAGLDYKTGNLGFILDYSYVPFESFDGVHMFNFDFKF